MFTLQLSESFYENVEILVKPFWSVLQFCPAIIKSRAALYANALEEEGCSLESCVHAIQSTKR